MPISLECECGKKLKVSDAMAGKKARCPGCKAVLDVPKADSPSTDEESEEIRVVSKTSRKVEEPEESEEIRVVSKKVPKDDDSISAKPKKQPAKAESSADEEVVSKPRQKASALDEALTSNPKKQDKPIEDDVVDSKTDEPDEEEIVESKSKKKDKPTEDEEADDPRGKKKKAKAKSSGKKGLLIWGLVAVAAMLFCCCAPSGLVGVLYFTDNLPFVGGLGEHAKYLPDDCNRVESVRVDVQRNSKVYKDHGVHSGFFVGSVNSTNLSESDITRITRGWNSKGDVTIVSTKTEIGPTILKSPAGLREAKVGKYTLYEPSGFGGTAYCFLNKNLFLMGNKDVLRRILERDKEPELSSDMKKAMGKVSFSKAEAYVSVRGESGGLGEQPIMQYRETDFSSSVVSKTTAVYADSAAAERQKKATEDILKMFTNKEGVTWSVSQSGNSVTVKFTYTGDFYKKNKVFGF